MQWGTAEIGIERDGLVITGNRFLEPSGTMERCPPVDPVGCRIWLDRERPIEARQGFAGSAKFTEHIRAVAVRVRQVGVAFDGTVETLQGVIDLAHAVKRLADQVMCPGLSRTKRQRAAGQIDALLKLAFVAGDQRNVIERIGVARIIAQHLGIPVHGQRNLTSPVVDQPLLNEFGGRLRFAHGALVSRL